MTIKFIGNEIGDITTFKGFGTSSDLLFAVRGGFHIGYGNNDELVLEETPSNLQIGEYLFDYETGTMWEVVE